MKVTAVTASCHNVPVAIPLAREPQSDGIVCVRVETDEGIDGIGFTGGRENRFAMRETVLRDLGPLVVGRDPLRGEAVWEPVVRKLGQKSLAGGIAHAMSAIDIALWDIKGKILGQPVHRLLGGRTQRLPVYATIGNFGYGTDELVAVARDRVAEGFGRIKLAVGRTEMRLPARDAEHVAAVRAAVGEEVEIMVDANQQFDFREAADLARRIEPYTISWFEEPVRHNDFRDLAALRSRTPIPIAAGQNQAMCWSYRHQIAGGAMDIVQADVIYVGGFTEGLKVAHLAQAFELPLTSHGWPHLNMHLIAGVTNGWLLELHAKATKVCQAVLVDPPMPVEGFVTLPEAPGLGLTVNEAALDNHRES